MPPITMKDVDQHRRAAANNAYENAARLCEGESWACIGDIVPGDEIGSREARARAEALLTASADIRKLII